MSASAAPLLLERRAQYFDYLLDAVRVPIHKRVREWRDAILADKAKKPQALKHLQDALAKVPNWNALRVATETAAVVRDDDVEYLPKLLSALIAVETKLFILDEAIEAKDITVRVPTLDAFVHQCFVEASRAMWKNIALFDPSISKLAQQQNYVTCENLVAKAVKDAVRHLLPIKDIVRHMTTAAPSGPATAAASTSSASASAAEDEDDEEEEVGGADVFESSGSDNEEDEEAYDEEDGEIVDVRAYHEPPQTLYEEASVARLQREPSTLRAEDSAEQLPLKTEDSATDLSPQPRFQAASVAGSAATRRSVPRSTASVLPPAAVQRSAPPSMTGSAAARRASAPAVAGIPVPPPPHAQAPVDEDDAEDEDEESEYDYESDDEKDQATNQTSTNKTLTFDVAAPARTVEIKKKSFF